MPATYGPTRALPELTRFLDAFFVTYSHSRSVRRFLSAQHLAYLFSVLFRGLCLFSARLACSRRVRTESGLAQKQDTVLFPFKVMHISQRHANVHHV